MIKAVLFDLDATLTDRKASIAQFCVPFRRHFQDALADVAEDVLQTTIVAADGGGYRSRTEMCAEVVAVLPWRRPPAVSEFESLWWREFPHCTRATAGVHNVVESLIAQGLTSAIITNGGSPMQNAKIDALGLRPHMKAIVISQDLGIEKPEAAIFQHTLRLIGVAPDEALFVGDDPSRDIVGARNAGLRPVWFRAGRTWPLSSPPPQVAIDSLPELLEVLAGLRAGSTA